MWGGQGGGRVLWAGIRERERWGRVVWRREGSERAVCVWRHLVGRARTWGEGRGKGALFTACSQSYLFLALEVVVARQVLAQCAQHDHGEQARQKEDYHEAAFARGRGGGREKTLFTQKVGGWGGPSAGAEAESVVRCSCGMYSGRWGASRRRGKLQVARLCAPSIRGRPQID